MATTYKDLLQQREALEARIKETRDKEVGDAVERIKAMVQEFGLTQEEVFPLVRNKPAPSKGTKVAPKYRDPVSGALWTGRGRTPVWFDKDKADDYRIQSESTENATA